MSRTLLLVDNDVAGNKLVAIVLREGGWKVTTAATATAALAILATVRPRLIVTELDLPDLDGLELVRIVRAHDARIPIVVFTDRNSGETVHRVRQAGCTAYIHKPIDVATFATELVHALGEP